MNDEQRRASRISGDVLIYLRLEDSLSEKTLAGPTSGIIHNIASYGAGLRLSQVHIENYHLFYAAQENPDFKLILEIPSDTESDETFSIPVQPIWFDRATTGETEGNLPFQMGVEFLVGYKDERIALLKELFAGRGGATQSFWRSFKEKIDNYLKK